MLSIGALSRATGIPPETLRTWEQREPVSPARAETIRASSLSNHQCATLYDALPRHSPRGHRAREAVKASENALSILLTVGPVEMVAASEEPSGGERNRRGCGAAARFVETFNAERLTRSLLTDWKRLAPLRVLLQTRIAPLTVRAVGEEWAAARLEIRHERFLSERVSDVLRSLRLPFEEKAKGPLVVCASLPGEEHGLGLQMVALLLAVVGCRLLFLGTEVPPTQIASLRRARSNARTVAVSVSSSQSRGANDRTDHVPAGPAPTTSNPVGRWRGCAWFTTRAENHPRPH